MLSNIETNLVQILIKVRNTVQLCKLKNSVEILLWETSRIREGELASRKTTHYREHCCYNHNIHEPCLKVFVLDNLFSILVKKKKKRR